VYKRRLVSGILWTAVLACPAITAFAVGITTPPAVALHGPVEPDGPTPAAQPQERGSTGLLNPALGKSEMVPGDDPLAAFSRRPLEGRFIIPEGGLFLDPLHQDPHFGIDYTNPDLYLVGEPIYVYPIGPGYVTARSECLMCFVDGDIQGRVQYRKPEYNFGWGGLVLVETPYTPDVSIYVLYAHLKRDFVSLGDYVEPDEVIAVAGSSGYSEEIHLHLEVRFGLPGRFWNADFGQQATLDRWLATMFANPAVLVFPEYHPSFVTTLAEWVALRPRPAELP
jgi:hypothetical protein